MSTESGKAAPRHYFLNERHQLAPTEKDGGGKTTPVVGVNWSGHGAALSSKLGVLRSALKVSSDPSAKGRLFILAKPAPHLTKESKSKKALEQGGKLSEKVDFAGQNSQVLRKLGFDLIAVQSDGSAVVHAPEVRLDQIAHTLKRLGELGVRDRNKWATVSEFTEVPVAYKCSKQWWPDLRGSEIVEAVIDLQPLLPRAEIDALIREIASRLGTGEKLKRIGSEFTGRRWLMAQVRIETALQLASVFQAIYSIHPPLLAIASASRPRAQSLTGASVKVRTDGDLSTLPCVAILDTGVPVDHIRLAPYCRGRMIGEGLGGGYDAHGSHVASRIVFGDVDCAQGDPELVPQCRFYDVNLCNGPASISEDAVDNAVATIASNSPDVRVFNISFDARFPLESFSGSHRDAVLRKLADLDNRAFANDILFVIAAGNSPSGVVPTPHYPKNYGDPNWSLRTWPRCFNALTCGGATSRFPASEGLAKEPGAPSPFTRVGPGFARSPKPDLCAHAGNSDAHYAYPMGSGLGVWCCNEDGLWEDHAGTSFAAPVVARTAAMLFAFLQGKCGADSRPYAALVKAVLALKAKRSDFSPALQSLAKRTIGYGSVDFESATIPRDDRAVFLWQGFIENEGDLLIVELPLPGEWLRSANNPMMRLMCAWDTPVNSAVEHVWACRRVEVTLRTSAEAGAMRPASNNPLGYPLAEKLYKLADFAAQGISDRDSCLMELTYTHQEMAEYPAGVVDFSPQQRIAIAYELWDDSEVPISPHVHVQALPVANTLDRLSIATLVRQSISIRTVV